MHDNKFRENVLGQNKLLIAFEVVPPSVGVVEENGGLEQHAQNLIRKLGPQINDLCALLLPEISNGVKKYVKPRDYAVALGRLTLKNLVLYHVSVSQPVDAQAEWLQETAKMGYRNIIPVGGDSSQLVYSGPSPIEFALITDRLNSGFFQGAVCIPSRGMVPRNGRSFNFNPELEPRRMIEKERANMRYHVTQVIYDTRDLENMFEIYKIICERAEQQPSRIFIGVTPVLDESNLTFLERRLDVVVPEHFKRKIGASYGPTSIPKTSMTHIIEMLQRFFDKTYAKYPNSRFGVYVETIRTDGMGICVDFLGKVKEVLKCYQNMTLHGVGTVE